MKKIKLDDISYGHIYIKDEELVNYSSTKIDKTVVVTKYPDKWKYYLNMINSDNDHIIFTNGDGSYIRGYRARNVFILSDSSLSYEDLNDIIAGFVAVSKDPIKAIKDTALYKTKKALGIEVEEIKQNNYQILWNKSENTNIDY